jgi:hypothetical protein
MTFLLKLASIILCLSLLTLARAPAAPGIVSNGPNCKQIAFAPAPSLWLGHFSGGAVRRDPISQSDYIIWHDDHACFTSWRDCQTWQRDMRRLFNRVQGYRTCLFIR